jgi:Domain of unknown function (DUF6378)
MTSLRETLKEREWHYGSFSDVAHTLHCLKAAVADCNGTRRMGTSERCALDMIFMKIARLVNGDPSHRDSWHDIAGYATLIVNMIDEIENDDDHNTNPQNIEPDGIKSKHKPDGWPYKRDLIEDEEMT